MIRPHTLTGCALALLLGSLHGAEADAQTLLAGPWLQTATPTSAWILWETDDHDESRVEWGPVGEPLSQSTEGASLPHSGGRVHEVQLTGLEPGATYAYRVVTGAAMSEAHRLTTPERAEAEAPIGFIAMSDMQIDRSNPEVFTELIRDGVIPYVQGRTGEVELDRALTMVLIPGDLVENGDELGQWRGDFFGAGAPLFSRVPLYPVPGNHERDSPHFFRYFHLPENGSPGYAEHWWYHDVGNVRVIGLDSNGGYRVQEQLDWLDGVLADACDQAPIDFVFAQLHHPYRSELWIAGNTDYTGDVVERLERFTEGCGKPSVHFFGHTHGYSRGQSRDHSHLHVNVASAGGNIDYWGEFAQQDYDVFTVSQDEYGFVHVEVEAGDSPRFRMRRISRGNEARARDNEIRDEIVVRRGGAGPLWPRPISPWRDDHSPDCLVFQAGAFEDRDEGTRHQASHWQVSRACDDFSAPLRERWVQQDNWYGGENTQAGVDLKELQVEGLEPDSTYCWRVRYRSDGLTWSPWSEPLPFSTGASMRTANLLTNPGAEEGLAGWQAVEGVIESLQGGECDSVAPHSGERLFAVGGVCEGESERGEALQRVDVSAWGAEIDAGEASAVLRGHLRDFGGQDVPAMFVVLRDSAGGEVGRSEPVEGPVAAWSLREVRIALPPGVRAVEVHLTGTRNAGSDNDSYFDDLELRLDLGEQVACEAPSAPEPPVEMDAGVDTGEDAAGEDTSAGDVSGEDTGAGDDADAEASPDAREGDSGVAADSASSVEPDAGQAPGGNDGAGCGCRVGAPVGGEAPWWLAVWLGVGLTWRRRSRRMEGQPVHSGHRDAERPPYV